MGLEKPSRWCDIETINGSGSGKSSSMECDIFSDSPFSSSSKKKSMPKLFSLFLLFLFFYFAFLLLPRLNNCYFTLPFCYVFGNQQRMGKSGQSVDADSREGNPRLPCPSMVNGSISCDRTGFRSDICCMKGDIRINSSTFSVSHYSFRGNPRDRKHISCSQQQQEVERIRPYPRKWETNIMEVVDQLKLIPRTADNNIIDTCQVRHSVPAIFFSTGGYTGNLYHEFNDGIIPLYITSRRYRRRVVFVILNYRNWWFTKYGDIISRLSDYPPIDFSNDGDMHCFSEAIVGLQIHDELTVHPSSVSGDTSIQDFRMLLDEAYGPRIRGLIKEEESQAKAPAFEGLEGTMSKPKLVILSRNGSRAILNEGEVVELAERIGFQVEVLKPTRTMELAKIYRVLNSSEGMIGVHGAAMTHLLFMRPGSFFIQIVVLGTKWAADTYYGEPASKLGLNYIGYEILPTESSLYEEYDADDPVIRDPKSITKRGWDETKRVYLDRQNVRLDLERFSACLVDSYRYTMSQRKLN